MTTNLENTTMLITGANAGIGRAAALQLAQRGAQVVVLCRNPERGAEALEAVRRASPTGQGDLLLADMADQASVRAAADEFLSRHTRLDVLIHNAANFDHRLKQPVLTRDGVETVFATNHVNIVLLTQRLLPVLTASAPSRIITVASKGLISYPFLDIEFDNLNGQKKYNLQHAYYHAKQAQVMFTFDLAQRLQGTRVTVNCVRVGNVAIPDTRLDHLPGWLVRLYHAKRKFAMTPEKMAETYTWLATDPALATTTGGYWDAPNVPVRANAKAYNQETWRKLREATEQLIRTPTPA